MPSVQTIVLTDDQADQRVDHFLVRCCKGAPKSHIYKLLRTGQVRVNKRRVTADYRLQSGDVVRIPPVSLAPTKPAPAPALARQVVPPIVFEDEALLVVNKPAGLAVHGGSGISLGLIEALRSARPTARFLELVHRLDRDTSGLLMVAKKRSALTALHERLREGKVAKEYCALVLGEWPEVVAERWLDLRASLFKYLDAKGERRVRQVAAEAEQAIAAHTRVRLRQRYRGFTLVELQLKTGRTHQIRVHLAGQGYPIAGDARYGDFARNHELERGVRAGGAQGEGTALNPRLALPQMFLHAGKLAFDHPLKGERVELEAPLSLACQQFLAVLTPESLAKVPA